MALTSCFDLPELEALPFEEIIDFDGLQDVWRAAVQCQAELQVRSDGIHEMEKYDDVYVMCQFPTQWG